ncbi:hypothetical protein [Halosimplex halobium]|uniref:hypothetical protein n=1 Tax=Halosimplex halobium TaxID=3396618 RepID=UPI003F55618D
MSALSPLMAYGEPVEPISAQGAENYERFAHMGGGADAVYERTWFHVAVLLAWSLGSLALGYLRFSRPELG